MTSGLAGRGEGGEGGEQVPQGRNSLGREGGKRALALAGGIEGTARTEVGTADILPLWFIALQGVFESNHKLRRENSREEELVGKGQHPTGRAKQQALVQCAWVRFQGIFRWRSTTEFSVPAAGP